jgi:hypothetical protein
MCLEAGSTPESCCTICLVECSKPRSEPFVSFFIPVGHVLVNAAWECLIYSGELREHARVPKF